MNTGFRAPEMVLFFVCDSSHFTSVRAYQTRHLARSCFSRRSQYEVLDGIFSSCFAVCYSKCSWWCGCVHCNLIWYGISRVSLKIQSFERTSAFNSGYYSWSPYNSASGQSSIQRQYSTYDPLVIKDLSVCRSHSSTATVQRQANVPRA